jgi:hypothetical protein
LQRNCPKTNAIVIRHRLSKPGVTGLQNLKYKVKL